MTKQPKNIIRDTRWWLVNYDDEDKWWLPNYNCRHEWGKFKWVMYYLERLYLSCNYLQEEVIITDHLMLHYIWQELNDL